MEAYTQSMGTLVGFPNYTISNSKLTGPGAANGITDYTCAIFTYNPRISADGNYYEVDI